MQEEEDDQHSNKKMPHCDEQQGVLSTYHQPQENKKSGEEHGGKGRRHHQQEESQYHHHQGNESTSSKQEQEPQRKHHQVEEQEEDYHDDTKPALLLGGGIGHTSRVTATTASTTATEIATGNAAISTSAARIEGTVLPPAVVVPAATSLQHKKNMSTIVREINCNDVLNGRKNNVYTNLGNVFYRKLVRAVKVDYIAATKGQKRIFARLIYQRIKFLNPPGRFLQQTSNSENGSVFHEIGEDKVLLKVRQALREGAPEIKRMLNEGSVRPKNVSTT